MFGKRILILVAHPDDEVVASAACIARARAAGADIAAFYLTHGYLAQEVLWPWERKHCTSRIARRRAEAEAAAAMLGIHPWGWVDRPARHLWWHLTDVARDVDEAMAHYKPDQVWVPAYEGGNPDHDALNAVGSRLRARLSVLEFAEYNFFGGREHSQNFIASDQTVRIVTLTAEERKMKRSLLDLYASEKSNLSYVNIEQEVYRPLATYDYTQPPHQGKVWYTRFHWVPFYHPRIDRTTPARVSEEITKFLS